ncbi:unnamed protein product [Amoebophrya sp. A120]|nr:unnamed protein product [Amoebophrya sp. A120]|eukprot:GSA120T00020923001.1
MIRAVYKSEWRKAIVALLLLCRRRILAPETETPVVLPLLITAKAKLGATLRVSWCRLAAERGGNKARPRRDSGKTRKNHDCSANLYRVVELHLRTSGSHQKRKRFFQCRVVDSRSWLGLGEAGEIINRLLLRLQPCTRLLNQNGQAGKRKSV